MTVEQLIKELAGVAPRDANEWRDLRQEQLKVLSPDDNAAVYEQWRKLSKLNANT